MKKLGSSLKNMLLALTGVTVIAVGLLAYVNELTKEPIATANMKVLNDALEKVVPEFDNNPVAECDTIFEEKNGKQLVQYIIYPAKSGGQLVGTAVQATSLGFGGEIKALVGFDAAGKIYDYALLAHAETPGLGSKADVWFKKGSRGDIVGMDPGKAPLVVKNDGGQIDAITASTITTRAFLNVVNAAYAAYKGNPDGFTSASQQADTDTNTSATTKVEPTDSISAN
ncbi:MAG: RnfABCDGE type electron transport complex subunit G [Mediterranea sp.]|jgi:electron transport complex protein RnfG|nr:RnfABCDGE type electron transport complex subunit G [Mediterranea sp.]